MNLTRSYPFDTMAVGDSFTVRERFQHARVAASEYARRNGMAFTCRMQPDRTLRISRCENNQAFVDQRGSRGRRRIVTAVIEPDQQQFSEWLSTFAVGQSYTMPSNYHHVFSAMIAWCELIGYRTSLRFDARKVGDQLTITRTI